MLTDSSGPGKAEGPPSMGPVIEISDFGPLRRSKLELLPLTVFIGKNATGKSYAATVAYALLNSLAARRRVVRAPRQPVRPIRHSPKPNDESIQEFGNLVSRLISDHKFGTLAIEEEDEDEFSVRIGTLPTADNALCSRVLSEMVGNSAELIGEELTRCFGSELAPLIRRGALPPRASIVWSSNHPRLRGQVDIAQSGASGNGIAAELDDLVLRVPLLSAGHRGPPSRAETKSLTTFAAITARDALWDDALEAVAPRAHYLPAARSGIMHTHRLAAASWMEEAPLFGLKRVDVPIAAGTVLDFLAETILVGGLRPGPLTRLASQIEREVLRGEIIIREGRTAYPDILYKEGNEEFPLQLASSMISELAPLVLLLKYRLRPGELLIIEEPEAHLHPSAQVEFANSVAALVRAGVRVLLTTHSDFMIGEINNLIRLGELDKRQSGVSTPSKFLSANEVAAYLFIRDDSMPCVEARRLGVEPVIGIPTSQITEVVEALHERAVTAERDLEDGGDGPAR
jgi:hypothetical protein